MSQRGRRSGRPPQQRSRKPKRRGGKKPQADKPRKTKLVDVHLRVGLDDEIARLDRAGLAKLINMWVLGGEDIVLRGARNSYEVNVILRGTASGSYTIREANPDANIPRFDVISAEELRAERIAQVQRKKAA